jgi:fatty acid desaturase
MDFQEQQLIVWLVWFYKEIGEFCGRLSRRLALKEKSKESEGLAEEKKLDHNLWYIHGNAYDLKDYVPKHPGGQLAILSARGRDCTALFESYHPWNDNNRKVIAAYGPKPPPCDPVYEDMKLRLRKLYPKGCKETKVRPTTVCVLLLLQSLLFYLFFVVRTYLSSLMAGVLVALFSTRLSHEALHMQMSHKPWVNRLLGAIGYSPVAPSMCWYYRHVISHHPHTNEDDDVDVVALDWLDALPPKFNWLKMIGLPFAFASAPFAVGLGTLIEMFAFGSLSGHHVSMWVGQLIPETIAWFVLHGFFGPPLLCYLFMFISSGTIFVIFSQIAHAVVYPDSGPQASWAVKQMRTSINFAPRSTFWYHMAFGLTTQIDHHLFPGVGEHCLDDVHDEVVKPVAKKHGIPIYDVSAATALGFLWERLMTGRPVKLD